MSLVVTTSAWFIWHHWNRFKSLVLDSVKLVDSSVWHNTTFNNNIAVTAVRRNTAPVLIPDSCVTGALSGRGRRTRQDDRRWAGVQHPPGHQLPGVTAQKELAERACPLHQEHHGKTPTPLLNDGFCLIKMDMLQRCTGSCAFVTLTSGVFSLSNKTRNTVISTEKSAVQEYI